MVMAARNNNGERSPEGKEEERREEVETRIKMYKTTKTE